MALYTVRIRTRKGTEVTEIEAESKQSASQKVRGKGRVLKIRRKWGVFESVSLSRQDRAVLFQRLATMTASRIGVGESLRMIQTYFKGRMSRVASQLYEHISNGAELVDAMDAVGERAFPESVRAIVRAGSQGGNLSEALYEALRFERESEQVKKESRGGLLSALGGFAGGVGTLLGLKFFLVPQMQENPMMKALDVETKIPWVEWMGLIMASLAGVIIGLIGLSAFLLYIVRPAMPSKIDQLVLAVPFFRDLVLARRNYIIFYSLSVLLRAGLRVEQALRLSRDNADAGKTKEDLGRALQAVRKGQDWPYAMTSLHPTDQAALATGQDRIQIAESVEAVAMQYREIFRSRMELLVPTFQAISVIYLGGSGVLLFGAIMLPMLDMTQMVMNEY